MPFHSILRLVWCASPRHGAARWLGGALAALVCTAQVLGYAFITQNGGKLRTWSPGSVPIKLQLGSTPTYSDGSNPNAVAAGAISTWNSLTATVQLSPQLLPPGPHSTTDGINQLDFDSTVDGDPFGSGVLAVTVSNTDDNHPRPDGSYILTEADITFNTAYQWDSYRGPLQAVKQDLQRVALHELGHVYGLDHPDDAGQDVDAIMNSVISDLDRLTTDDVDGVQFLYGVSPTLVRPPNDSFTSAATLTLTGNSATVTGSNLWATKEPGEPNHAPGEAGGASVWWKWTAPAPGSVVITTAGSDYDTMLAAYTGTAVNALTQLAGNDDESASPHIRTSRITFSVTGGVTYYIAVDGWDGDYGSIVMSLTLTPTGSPFITSQPASQTIAVGGGVTFTVSATGNPTLTYQWRKGSVPIPGATSASYSIAGVTFANAGSYDVVVTNAAGSATSSAATLTVVLAPQTITFAAPADQPYSATPVTLSATASSGLPVSYSLLSGPATLSGAALTLTGAGTVTVRASQAGNATYAAAPNVDRSFIVTKAVATVALGSLTATYDRFAKHATVTTNPAGLAVSLAYNGSGVEPVNAGSYTVVATINDANYQGSATGTLTIAQDTQTITFYRPSDQPFTPIPVPLTALASSGLPVVFTVLSGPAVVNGANLNLSDAGPVTVRASQPGDGNYLPAPNVDQSFTTAPNFESWRREKFTAAELADAGRSGPGAVYGLDGCSNLLKYALGLDPRTDATTGLPQLAVVATDWVFTYTKAAGLADVSCSVDVSTDLVTWNPVGTQELVSTAGGLETWRVRYPLSLTDRPYFRVTVLRP